MAGFAEALSWDAAPQPRGGGKSAAPDYGAMRVSMQQTPEQIAEGDARDRSPAAVAELQAQMKQYAGDPVRLAPLQAELARVQGPQAVSANDPGFARALSWDAPSGPGKAAVATVSRGTAAPAAPQVRSLLEDAPGQAAAAIGSGIAGTVLGGLRGIYETLATGSTDKGADAVRATQKALTYQPTDARAQTIVDLVGSGWNPLNWPGMGGKWLAGKGVDTGALSPIDAAALEAAAAVVTPGMLLRGARGAPAVAKPGPVVPEGSSAVPLKSGGFGVQTTQEIGGGTSLAQIGARPVTAAARATLPAAAAPGSAPAAAPEKAAFGSAGSSATSNAAMLKADMEAASPEMRQALSLVKPGKLNPEAAARHLEADSLPVPVKLTAGQATQDVGMLSREQNSRAKSEALRQRFNEQNGQLVENVNAIREKAAPDVYGTNHVENGQALIDAYKTTDKALRSDISARYKALEEANGGRFPVDGVAFVDAAEAALAKALKTEFVPAGIARQMEKFKAGEPMTFEQFEAMRTNLAAEIRKAERSGDGNAAYASGVVREALESLPMTGETAALKPIADAARAAAKARFDLLKKDPAYRAAVNDVVAADDFINKFVVKGKAGDIKTMVAHLGPDSVAHQTMAAGVINYLKNRAGIVNEAGNFSQAGYNKAMQELQPKLLDIVGAEAAKNLSTLGNVARYTQAQPRGSFVNNSNTFVAAAGEHAANVAEIIGNRVVGLGGIVPVGSMVRGAVAKNRADKEAMRSLQTGAGVSLKDIGR